MRKEIILIIMILFVAGCTNINPFNQQQKVTLGTGIELIILNAPEEIFPDDEFSITIGLINYLDSSISGNIKILDKSYLINKEESFSIDAAILDKKIIPAKIPEEGDEGIEISGLMYSSEAINEKGIIINKDNAKLNILLDYDAVIDLEGSLDTSSRGYTLSENSFGVIASTAPVGIERVVYSKERDVTKLIIKFRNVGNGRITSKDNEINIRSVSSEGTEYKCNKNKVQVEEREESSIICNANLDEGKHQLRISYNFPYEIKLGIEVPISIEE